MAELIPKYYERDLLERSVPAPARAHGLLASTGGAGGSSGTQKSSMSQA